MIKGLVFDDASGARRSARSIDSNGFMRVKDCPLTKEQVAPYLGREIPNYRVLGLEADRIYQVYRPASELSKPSTLNSVKGIPLLLDHAPVSAEDIREDQLVGSLGDAVRWDGTYLRCNLNILAKKAQDHINDKSMRELSLSYAYTPVLKSGAFNGKHYDLVMRDIKANHLALVEAGRAGSDVRVCDSLPTELKQMEEKTEVLEILNKVLDAIQGNKAAPSVADADPIEEDQDDTEEAVFNDANEADDPEASDSEEKIAEDEGEDQDDASDSDEEIAEDEDEIAEDEDEEKIAEDEDQDEAAEDSDDLAEDEDDDKFANILKGLGIEPSDDMIAALKELANKMPAADKAQDSGRAIRRAKARRAAKSKRVAMDSKTYINRLKAARNIGRKQGATAAIKRMRSLETAANICAPILGKISPIAFDSAAAIYKEAAIMAGMSPKYAKDTKAARGYVLAELKHSGAKKRFAMDGQIKATASNSMAAVRGILNNIEG